MKNTIKYLTIAAGAVVLVLIPISAKAGLFDYEDTIGLRVGGGYMTGAEISYQTGIEDENRLELGVSFRSYSGYSYNTSYIGAVGSYQWIWEMNDNGFNWYAGPCAGVGYWSWKYKKSNDSGIFIDAGGVIGIEYDFSVSGDVPWVVSLDFRPMVGLSGYSDFGWGIGIAGRYKF